MREIIVWPLTWHFNLFVLNENETNDRMMVMQWLHTRVGYRLMLTEEHTKVRFLVLFRRTVATSDPPLHKKLLVELAEWCAVHSVG